MISFPLYENLLAKIDNVAELPDKDKDTLIDNLKQLDDTGQELVYALIKVHHIKMTDQFGVPYDMKLLKNGVRFNLDKFDDTLQNILQEFIKIHNERIALLESTTAKLANLTI